MSFPTLEKKIVGFEIQTNKKWLQISVQLQYKLQTAMESIQIFYSHSKILVLNEQNIEVKQLITLKN